ncbi:FliJ family flagellar protein [Buttiauxella brennerae ATCC 51605]|jgi:flagellar FliJ protein|uniref:Flagellar FliJ protein n=1 Tax=Buttiauxella brennerae ATCC 51605 TaxID=1354251 RepID=A0A1B7IPB9_9ENTR|nr:flagellar export protein FliJ [Buttiauxella brennerae]OAT31546.1 FliJ family flagellar protein [Buttiauxella brennerae ATCC 51605]
MNQSTALDTLRDLAEKEVEDAAVRLGEMRRSCQAAEEQLNMLMNYQFEYSSSLNNSMAEGIASNRWQNYQQFIQTLEKAIDQHRQQLLQWNNKVNQALNLWQEKQKRLQAWRTLQDRKAAQVLLAENKLDQKQMDEYAQRATLRKVE